MPLILEGIVTTQNSEGVLNIAPMGPLVDEDLTSFTFRPFESSQTYQNLKRSRQGVFHVIDDVYLIAQGAIDRWLESPETFSAETISGRVLSSACRWYEFEIVELRDESPRSTMTARVLHQGKRHDFWGFNRAKHAVLEAAILATRVHLLDPQELQSEFERLQLIVAKTAGPREAAAFALLLSYVTERLSAPTAIDTMAKR
ncbi:MAG: DUF447 family protein [Planctomycetota bacterium]|nr:DUF447 family protein [Planctomycetota bacterium]MDA1214725.1 DUF447 family protein [Planctomycetota bacterium]